MLSWNVEVTSIKRICTAIWPLETLLDNIVYSSRVERPFFRITAEEAAALDGRAGAAYARDSRLRFVMSSGGMNFLEVARAMGNCHRKFFSLVDMMSQINTPAPTGVIGYIPDVIGADCGGLLRDKLSLMCAQIGLPPHSGFGPASLLAGLVLVEQQERERFTSFTHFRMPTDDVLPSGERVFVSSHYLYNLDIHILYGFQVPWEDMGGLAWGLFAGS